MTFFGTGWGGTHRIWTDRLFSKSVILDEKEVLILRKKNAVNDKKSEERKGWKKPWEFVMSCVTVINTKKHTFNPLLHDCKV